MLLLLVSWFLVGLGWVDAVSLPLLVGLGLTSLSSFLLIEQNLSTLVLFVSKLSHNSGFRIMVFLLLSSDRSSSKYYEFFLLLNGESYLSSVQELEFLWLFDLVMMMVVLLNFFSLLVTFFPTKLSLLKVLLGFFFI